MHQTCDNRLQDSVLPAEKASARQGVAWMGTRDLGCCFDNAALPAAGGLVHAPSFQLARPRFLHIHIIRNMQGPRAQSCPEYSACPVREEVSKWMTSTDWGSKTVCVRINPMDTPLWEADVSSTLKKETWQSVVFPKRER